MATFKRFEDIVAWQEARALSRIVYAMTRKGQLAKDFGLRDQIQRAAVSVGSNIAEGFARSGNKEFLHFLWRNLQNPSDLVDAESLRVRKRTRAPLSDAVRHRVYEVLQVPLWIAHGSAAEVQSQLYTILDVGYITEQEFNEVYNSAQHCSMLIYKLIQSMKKSSLIGNKYL